MKRFFLKTKARSNASSEEKLSDKNNNRDKRCFSFDFDGKPNHLLSGNTNESSSGHEYETLMSESDKMAKPIESVARASTTIDEKHRHKVHHREESAKRTKGLKTDRDNYIVYGICSDFNAQANAAVLHKSNLENPSTIQPLLVANENIQSNQQTNSNNQPDIVATATGVSHQLPNNELCNAEIPNAGHLSCIPSSNIVSFLASCCIPTNTDSGQTSPGAFESENSIVYSTIAFEPTSSKSSMPVNSTDDVKSALLNLHSLPANFLTQYKVFGNSENAANNCSEIISMHELFCNCNPSCCCHCQSAFVPNISECLACFHTVCGQLSDAHYCKLGSYEHVYPPLEVQNSSTGGSNGAGETAARSENAASQNRTNAQNTMVYSRDMVSHL